MREIKAPGADCPPNTEMYEVKVNGPRHLTIVRRTAYWLLMAVAFHLASSLLGLLALAQWVLLLFGSQANRRLSDFSRQIGNYLAQIAAFVGCASDLPPFPFSDWPPAD